jgi:hypothetical protein
MAPTIGPFAKTVGPYLPFQPIVRGAPPLGSVQVATSIGTAGQITMVGQSVDVVFVAVYGYVNRNVGPALPFQAVKRGNTTPANLNFNVSIDTPGQMTFTGQSVQVDIQSPRISAVKWDPGPYLEFSPRRYGHTAIAQTNITVPIDTAGQVTMAGQSVTANFNYTFNAGAMTLAGKSVTANFNTAITAGQVTLQGQSANISVGNNINVGIEAGVVTMAGQSWGLHLRACRSADGRDQDRH